MSMNQQCFFSKNPDILGNKQFTSGFWLTPVIRSAAKGWIEAQRQLGLFLLSRGMMHQEVPVLPSNFFWSRRGDPWREVGWMILGFWEWKHGRNRFFFGFVRRSLNLIWDFLWSEDSAVVMGVTFFLAFLTVLVMLAIYKASVPAYFWRYWHHFGKQQ